MDKSLPISVVVTTYNRSDALLAVLDGLSRQTDTHFEVVVADDGSADGHRSKVLAAARASSLKVSHVWHPDIGFTAGRVRNRGVGLASGTYIIFLDGDCVPEVDFVARHRALAQAGCFVNGSRILLSPGMTERVVARTESVVGRNALYWVRQRLQGHASKLLGHLRLPDGRFRVQDKFSWKGIRSCNMAVWRADFEAVDGFDESFVGWGHEDADFVLRLHNAGLKRKNGFCATEVFHLWHPEASRNQESANARLVRQRESTKIVRSVLGYSQLRIADDAVVTRPG
jgi:GT2 family glycosyltransferase